MLEIRSASASFLSTLYTLHIEANQINSFLYLLNSYKKKI